MKNKLTAVRYQDRWILRSRGKTVFGNLDYKFAVNPEGFEQQVTKEICEHMTKEYKAEYVRYETTDQDGWEEPVIMLVTFPTRKLAREAADYVLAIAMTIRMSA